MENISNSEKILAKKLWNGLSSNKHIVLRQKTVPINLFFHLMLRINIIMTLGSILDEMNICVRTGKLCANSHF